MTRIGFLVNVVLVTLYGILVLMSPVLAADQQPVTLRIAYIYAPDSGVGQAGTHYARLVQERTNGKITVQIFPSSQLGSEIQNREALMTGTLDMCIIGVPHFAAFVPEVAMTDLPYFWKGPEHFLTFWRSPIGKDFTSRYEAATKIKVLAVNWLTSDRHILAKKAVKTPADLRGVKIRVTQGFQHHYDGFLAMGASPVYMAFPEIYSALQQGVIDAMENPLEDMYTSKFHELAKYVSLTAHIFNSRTVQLNAQTWAKLTPETQAVMTKAAEEAGEYQNEAVRKIVGDVKGKMAKEGITFVEPDRGAFAERVRQQAHPKYIAKYTNGQALYDQIQGLAK